METVAKSTTRVSESAGCQNLKLMTVVKVVKFDVDVNVDESEHCLCQNVLDVQQLIFCVICSQLQTALCQSSSWHSVASQSMLYLCDVFCKKADYFDNIFIQQQTTVWEGNQIIRISCYAK